MRTSPARTAATMFLLESIAFTVCGSSDVDTPSTEDPVGSNPERLRRLRRQPDAPLSTVVGRDGREQFERTPCPGPWVPGERDVEPGGAFEKVVGVDGEEVAFSAESTP